MQLEISTPDRWHLRLPPDTPLPDFAAPEQALGEDLAQHLPQGAQGRRWRVHLSWLALTAFAILLIFASDAMGMADIWWNASTFGHCLLIPFILFWLRSEEHTSELQSLMRISYAV